LTASKEAGKKESKMKIVYLSRNDKTVAMLREPIKALGGRLIGLVRGVRPHQANAIATREVRALGLVQDGPGAVYTRMFQGALEDACEAADGAFPIRELPQRVDYDLLREVGVSDEEVAGLHERLTRRCSLPVPLLSGRLRYRLAAS
jgi:hypothetical protein